MPAARWPNATMPAELREFLDRSPHPYVVTTGDELQNLESQMPGQWRVVARRPRFLAKGEIVVLAPQVLLHLGKQAGPRGSKLL